MSDTSKQLETVIDVAVSSVKWPTSTPTAAEKRAIVKRILTRKEDDILPNGMQVVSVFKMATLCEALVELWANQLAMLRQQVDLVKESGIDVTVYEADLVSIKQRYEGMISLARGYTASKQGGI